MHDYEALGWVVTCQVKIQMLHHDVVCHVLTRVQHRNIVCTATCLNRQRSDARLAALPKNSGVYSTDDMPTAVALVRPFVVDFLCVMTYDVSI
jgi:hypothetical protein